MNGAHGEPDGEPEQGCGVSERAEQDHRDPAGASGQAEGPDRGAGAPGGGSVPGKRLSEGAASAAPGRLQTPAWRAGGHQGEHRTRKVSYVCVRAAELFLLSLDRPVTPLLSVHDARMNSRFL